MEHLSGAVHLSSSSKGGNHTVETRKQKKEKEERAIADLREKIPDIDNIFNIHGRIGNGTFSTVLLGSLKCHRTTTQNNRKLFAIKHLIPTSHPNRIMKELKCLIEIGGCDNVVGIDLCLRRNESVAFVMPYLAHDRFNDYFSKMDIEEIQDYMKNLLLALKRVHKFNIIHRDVKPSNFLYNRKSKQFMLVDFGLAQTVGCHGTKVVDLNPQGKRKIGCVDNMGPSEAKKSREEVANVPESLGHNLKKPLKQLNAIIIPKSYGGGDNNLASPVARDVKSVILAVSMANKLRERYNNPRGTPIRSNAPNPSPSTVKYNTNRSQNPNAIDDKCYCFGKNQVCNICLVKKEIPASRAGTPGYRPPEVLLKYVDQTTAVDMWAVGVIFISILSGIYPFFKAPDDFLALAEIVTIFGDEAIRRTAFILGRQLTMNRKCKPLDLRRLCVRLRNKPNIDRSELVAKYSINGKCPQCSNCQQNTFDCLCAHTLHAVEPCGKDMFPSTAYDLLKKLLEVNPLKRITAEEALNHPFFKMTFDST